MNDLFTSAQSAKKTRILIGIIILFHAVGFAGFFITSATVLFLSLVPWHLLLMLAVILYSHTQISIKFILFGLLIFISGFAAECTGVHTGLLFGHYNYGETLGIKLYGIPLMIGVNWFLLIYSTGVTLQKSRIKNIFLRIITGAFMLVLLDVLIEPVATQYDYWHWANNAIPAKNYICWFLLSVLMLFVFERFQFKKQGIVAPVLLLTQFVFFAMLELIG